MIDAFVCVGREGIRSSPSPSLESHNHFSCSRLSLLLRGHCSSVNKKRGKRARGPAATSMTTKTHTHTFQGNLNREINKRKNLPDTGNLGFGLELVLDRSGVDVVGTVNALGNGGVLVVVVSDDVGVGVLDVLAVDLEGQGGSSGGGRFSGEWRHVW